MKAFGNGIDPRVRLYASDTAIWREITPDWKPLYERLWNDGTITDLCQGRLIADNERSNTRSEPSTLTFEQPRIRFPAYPFEWSPSMYRDAASKCLALHEALFRKGLCLLDSHPWNYVFCGTTPLWVDLTSISEYEPKTVGASLRQFTTFFLNPLWLLCHDQAAVARSLLAHAFHDVPDAFLLDLAPGREWSKRRWPLRLLGRISAAQATSFRAARHMLFSKVRWGRLDFSRRQDALRAVALLRDEMNRIPRYKPVQKWTNYVQAGQQPLTVAEVQSRKLGAERFTNHKVASVAAWLDKLKPECQTVVDLACNNGLYAQIARLFGYESAGMDIDEGAVDSMYEFDRDRRIEVVSALNDLAAPRESNGLLTNPMPRFVDRFKADLTLCLAVVHHLYFGQYRMKFEHIIRLLSLYCKKYAVVEFIPPTDRFLIENYGKESRFAQYTEVGFDTALRQQFEVIEICPSFPDGRTLWVVKKTPVS